MDYNRRQLKVLFERIFEGDYTPRNLPEDLYRAIFSRLGDGVSRGLGSNLKIDNLDNLLGHYDHNIGVFSAAKTHHQVVEMSRALIGPDGKKVTFGAFKAKASEIFDTFNKNWLKTEYRTAFNTAAGARQWFDFDQDRDIAPMLRYDTTGDGRVRDEHADLDGITAHIDDPFWSTHFPPNGFNCRCDVTAHDLDDVTGTDFSEVQVPPVDPLFAFNPGKAKLIFNMKEHPYGLVADRYKVDQVNNFGLPVPVAPVVLPPPKLPEIKVAQTALEMDLKSLKSKGFVKFMAPVAKKKAADLKRVHKVETQFVDDFMLKEKAPTEKVARSIGGAEKNELEFIKTLSEKELNVISEWTTSTYIDINGFLRGRSGFDDLGDNPAFMDLVDTLSSVVKKAPKIKATTYRMMSFNDKGALLDFIAPLSEGSIFVDRGFMASSFDKIERFGGEYSVEMRIKGKNGMFIKELTSGGSSMDKEVLFDKGSKFKVDKIEFTGDGFSDSYTIELTEL